MLARASDYIFSIDGGPIDPDDGSQGLLFDCTATNRHHALEHTNDGGPSMMDICHALLT